eukprot:TRINITY_DN1991_c0_g1_i2.p1 TRINITY_DN1991_c0_g1~~TRINITY_DN1991_c0_g1_i2.p1  ORF type:complete len:439 (-),score=93.40 TRINITY_DN1991_c0_g1_i2:160-1476(-)
MAELKEDEPREFVCPVCMLDYLRNSRVPLCLPCGHSLCQSCSQKMPKTCTVCSGEIPRKLESFPVNNAVLDVLDFISNLESKIKALPNPAVVAAEEKVVMCEENPGHGAATVFCQECGLNFCSQCNDQAHKLRALQRHVRTPAKDKRQVICRAHGDALRYFCKPHNCKICRECRDFGNHTTCELLLMSDLEETNKQEVDKLARKLSKALEEVSGLREESSSLLKRTGEECTSALLLMKESEAMLLGSMTAITREINDLKVARVSLDPSSDRFSDDVAHIEQELSRITSTTNELLVSAVGVRDSILKSFFGVKKVAPPIVVVRKARRRTEAPDSEEGNALTICTTDQSVLMFQVVMLERKEEWILYPEKSRYGGLSLVASSIFANILGMERDGPSDEWDSTGKLEWSRSFFDKNKSFCGKARLLTEDGWSDWVEFVSSS